MLFGKRIDHNRSDCMQSSFIKVQPELNLENRRTMMISTVTISGMTVTGVYCIITNREIP